MAGSLGREVARERIEDLERPALDNRSYRITTLSNQLEVLLIHDAETDKASAALDVNVGSFNDWEDMPGIAHAVEHLLFMGTEKVSKYVSKPDVACCVSWAKTDDCQSVSRGE
jgi:insulysin